MSSVAALPLRNPSCRRNAGRWQPPGRICGRWQAAPVRGDIVCASSVRAYQPGALIMQGKGRWCASRDAVEGAPFTNSRRGLCVSMCRHLVSVRVSTCRPYVAALPAAYAARRREEFSRMGNAEATDRNACVNCPRGLRPSAGSVGIVPVRLRQDAGAVRPHPPVVSSSAIYGETQRCRAVPECLITAQSTWRKSPGSSPGRNGLIGTKATLTWRYSCGTYELVARGLDTLEPLSSEYSLTTIRVARA
jgi:hypothetical protein